MTSGCSVKKVNSIKLLDNDFEKITSSLAISQNIIRQRDKNTKSGKNLKLTKKDLRVLSNQTNLIQNSLAKVWHNDTSTQYSSNILKYGSQVNRYIASLSEFKNYSQSKSSYRKVAMKGYHIFENIPDNRRTKNMKLAMSVVASLDPSVKKEIKKDQREKDNKYKKIQKAVNRQNQYDKIRSAKKVNVGWKIVLSIAAILLIFVVFLQPSKADDSMSALNGLASDNLMSQAKPTGYTLYLLRTTKVLITVIALILIYLEIRG